jgi:PAS domain S-box-containing protein
MLLTLIHLVVVGLIVPQSTVAMALDAYLLLALAAAWAMVRLQRVQIARAWIVVTLWLYITIGCWLLGGIENPLLGSYVIFVLIVGLLYNQRQALNALILSIVTLVVIFIADINALLPAHYIELTPAYIGFNTLSATICVMLLIYLLLITTQATTNQLVHHRQALALKREYNLTALHQVTVELTLCASLEDVFRYAIELGRSKLEIDRLALFLLDEDSQMVVGTYGTDNEGNVRSESTLLLPITELDTFAAMLQERQKILVREDVGLWHDYSVIGQGWHITVSLWNGDRIFGWLVADNLLSQTPLSKTYIDLLMTYGTTLAQLIVRKQAEDNFRFSQRSLQAKTESLSAINKMAEQLHQANDVASVLNSMADALVSLLNTYTVIVYLLDEDKQKLKLTLTRNTVIPTPEELPLDNSLSGYAFTHRTVIISDDFMDDERLPLVARQQLVETPIKFMAFIPIVSGEERLGVIVLGFTDEIHQQTSDSQTYAAIGQTVGLALSNIRFINEIQREKLFSDNIIESIPNVFYMLSESGELVRWNANLEAILGYDAETLRRMSPHDFVTPADRASLDMLIQKTIASGSGSAYLHLSTHSDKDVPYIFSTRRYEINGKFYIVGTGVDLSDRMQLLEQLQYQTTQLHTAGDISKSIVTVLDTKELMQYGVDLVCQRFDYYYVGLFMTDKDKQYAILSAGSGDAGREMLEKGYRLAIDENSMIGRCISSTKAIIASNVEIEKGHYANPYLPQTRSEMALPLINRGDCLGAITVQSTRLNAFSSDDIAVMRFIADHLASAVVNARLYEYINRRQRYLGTMRRVTQRAIPERRLNVFIQTAVETLAQEFAYEFAAIFLVDYEAGEIRVGAFVDVERRELSSLSVAIDKGILGWVVQHRESYFCADSTQDAIYIPPPNLANIPRSVVAVPIMQYSKVIGLLVVRQAGANSLSDLDLEIMSELATEVGLHMENIRLYVETQNNAAELERRVEERTSQLQTVNRELESFAYSVSHDLRAPLRSIDGYSQALLEDYETVLDKSGKHFLSRIRVSSQRMGQLIDDLLTLSRVTRREFRQQEVDLSAMAAEIIDVLRHQDTERAVAVVIEEAITASGDARMLRIVLENLLGNAWKFTKSRDTATIEFTTLVENNSTVYRIADNGVGFNMEYADKLFKAFQRLHGMNEFEGTGIGLATVKRVIDRHGGRIWFEAQEDAGATCYFTIGDILSMTDGDVSS